MIVILSRWSGGDFLHLTKEYASVQEAFRDAKSQKDCVVIDYYDTVEEALLTESTYTDYYALSNGEGEFVKERITIAALVREMRRRQGGV